MSRNGQPWRLLLRLPKDYAAHSPELFEWLRDHLIPALLAAPIRVRLEFVPPDDESDRDIDETE